MADPEPGLYGGRYRIVESIGSGGSSTVYRAHDGILGLDVALKVITVDPQREETLRARMRLEAETMMRLSHPNILQVHAVGDEGGWFAMDLSVEGSLADHIAANRPDALRFPIFVETTPSRSRRS